MQHCLSRKKKVSYSDKLVFTSLSEVLIYIRLAQVGRFSMDSLSGYGCSQNFVHKFSKDFPVVYVSHMKLINDII